MIALEATMQRGILVAACLILYLVPPLAGAQSNEVPRWVDVAAGRLVADGDGVALVRYRCALEVANPPDAIYAPPLLTDSDGRFQCLVWITPSEQRRGVRVVLSTLGNVVTPPLSNVDACRGIGIGCVDARHSVSLHRGVTDFRRAFPVSNVVYYSRGIWVGVPDDNTMEFGLATRVAAGSGRVSHSVSYGISIADIESLVTPFIEASILIDPGADLGSDAGSVGVTISARSLLTHRSGVYLRPSLGIGALSDAGGPTFLRFGAHVGIPIMSDDRVSVLLQAGWTRGTAIEGPSHHLLDAVFSLGALTSWWW